MVMKSPHLKIALALGVICLMVASVCLVSNRDPCAHLKHLSISAGRLGLSIPRAYHLSDHVVGILHHREPFDYYCTELHKEEERLLANGDLVETQICIPNNRTARAIAIALHAAIHQTRAYCSHSVDMTNHSVWLISTPQDIAVLAAALK